MTKLLSWTLLLLALFAIVFSPVVAEDVEDDDLVIEDDEMEMDDGSAEEPNFDIEEVGEVVLEASADVSTQFIFPKYRNNELEIGEPVDLLIQLANNGESTYNLYEVGAYLHSKYDLTYFIQNYTTSSPAVVLEPGEELTLRYPFRPHQGLEPEEFHFSAYVSYNDTADFSAYRSTVVNQTIKLVDKPQEFDVMTALSYVATLAAIGAVVYFGLGGDKRIAAATASKSSDSTGDDWGEAYTPKARVSRRKSSRKTRSSKN